MKYTDNGLVLTKNEIVALLAFACDDAQQLRLYGVHLQLTERGVKARATNGHIALDAVGNNESVQETGEWFVHRDFLRGALKTLEKGCTLTLRFSGASLHDAAVHNVDGVEVSVFSWAQDAANGQMSFVDESAWTRIIEVPKGKPVKCLTINADYLTLMQKVARAAEVYGITCYPPPKSDEKMMFRVESPEHETTWLALVMPMRTQGDDGTETATE